jgi:hypothetical protein
MAQFMVTITIQGVGLDAARNALEEAGIQPHPPGWSPSHQGEAARMVGPEILAEVDADDAAKAEERVSQALPNRDYTVTARPL